ncbi:uncharacterized protein B0J16DRAFT_16458 [Fusarium flagelliforme]|uniref:uncharacterized protein n=1 Tax=Fusarium flagelliforme TaxID=2675880 RepID=UPI001E8E6B7C|nr:uncharacterized protein B0J16DRAFT_16458 [Fusarium flagelliforme]KAH7197270.1 hypothetical protein B0J16DRAFT_16458 [Fusarium flagelliforme]
MTMDKIPQECRDIIGSFLRNSDRLNLALVSKSFYYYFSSANWKSIWLRGKPEELYQTLGFFLDEKYTQKHPLIKDFKISIFPAPSRSETPAGLTKRIVDSLSQVTCVDSVELQTIYEEDYLDLAEFACGMAEAPRWDKVTCLFLDCNECIAAAALDSCELGVLEHVTLTSWCLPDDEDDNQMYRALKCKYSAQPHLLKSLQIQFPLQELDNGTWDLIHEQVKGVHQVIEDFPALDYLRIGNEASEHNSPASDNSSWQEFKDEIEELCKALNNSTLKEFDIEINASLVDRGFIARGLQEDFPDGYLYFFDDGNYLDGPDEDFEVSIDDWFLQLARKIGVACPNLGSVTVSYGPTDTAFFERTHGMTFEFI